jgi:hypothetical protein
MSDKKPTIDFNAYLEANAFNQPSKTSTVDFDAVLDSYDPRVQGNDVFLTTTEEERQQAADDLLRRIEEGKWDGEDTMLAARSFVDGLVLNKAEEIGSWSAALAYKVLNPGTEKSIGEIRGTMLSDLERESQQFREERPMAALATNVAGGILSPVSLKGGQMLSQGRNIRNAEAARRVQASAAGVVPGLADDASIQAQRQLSQMYNAGGTGLAGGARTTTAMSPAIQNIVSRTPVMAQATALAGLEGAAFGYEGATTEEKIQNAATTGLFSAAFPPALSALGYGANAISRTRIAQQLGQGKDDFVNLMFTESGMGDVYRHIVGKAFGAASLVGNQIDSVTKRLPKVITERGAKPTKNFSGEKIIGGVDEAEQTLKTMKKDAQTAITRARNIARSNRDDAVEQARQLKDDVTLEVTAGNRLKIDELDETARIRLNQVDEPANRTAAELEAAAVLEADRAVNKLQADFRSNALISALPSEAAEEAGLLTSLNPQQALQYLDDMWKNRGFRAAKSKTYSLDAESATNAIKRIVQKNSAAVALLDGAPRRVVSYLQDVLENKVANGKINGEDLIDIRSKLGQFINNLSDNKGAMRGLADEVQEYLDDAIRKQLSPEDAKSFDADKALWRNKRMVEEAITKATSGNRNMQGAFTSEDWIDAAKSSYRGLAARGKVVLQEEAQEISKLAKQRDLQIRELANKQAKEVLQEAGDEINAARLELGKAKRELNLQLKKQQQEINRQFRQSSRNAAERQRRDIALEQAKQDHRLNLSALDEALEAAKNKEKEIRELTTSKGSRLTIFEQSFASGVLGQVIGGAIGRRLDVGASLASGSFLARGLSWESTQRAIAGQTWWQNAIQRGLQVANRLAISATEKGAGVQLPAVLAGQSAQSQPR